MMGNGTHMPAAQRVVVSVRSEVQADDVFSASIIVARLDHDVNAGPVVTCIAVRHILHDAGKPNVFGVSDDRDTILEDFRTQSA